MTESSPAPVPSDPAYSAGGPDAASPALETGSSTEQPEPTASSESAATGLERESEIAADYLEELLDIADLDGDIDMDIERDRASVSVVGGTSITWSEPTASCSTHCKNSPGSRCSRPPVSGVG